MEKIELLNKIKATPLEVSFSEVIEVVEANYNFTPTLFKNGNTVNEVGQNAGSCKVFSFALLNNLTKEQTLNCFGDYYRIDVLENPEKEDHQNIRNFITFGWEGIVFEGTPLTEK